MFGAPIKFIKINNDIKDNVNNYRGTKKGENCATLYVYTQKFKMNGKKDFSTININLNTFSARTFQHEVVANLFSFSYDCYLMTFNRITEKSHFIHEME